MKLADAGWKPPLTSSTRAFRWGEGVFTLRAFSGSVLGVSSRSAALQRRPFSQPQGRVCAAAWGHSAATQSPDSSPASCWMKGSLCSPGSTRLSSLPVCPAHPTYSFLSLSFTPKREVGCPMDSSLRTEGACSVSPLSLSKPLGFILNSVYCA